MRLVIIIFLIIAFPGHISGQTLRTAKQDYSVDTLHILPAVGYIAWQDKKRQIYRNDSLSKVFAEMVKNAMPDSAEFIVDYQGDENTFDPSDKEYLMQAIPRLQRLDVTSFSAVVIGDDFARILENRQGRYFGFIYYEGFDQEVKYRGWGGVEIGTGDMTIGLNGEMATYFLNSGGPYLLINFLVVDKVTGNFLYFNNHVIYDSPFKEKKIKKYFRRIFDEI